MTEIKDIKLTDDPLKNIHIMIPMLDDQAREAVSYFIYGCCVGESIAKDSQNDKKAQAVWGRKGSNNRKRVAGGVIWKK